MFQNLTQGSTVYVLRTNGGLKLDVCQIEQTRPSFQYNAQYGAMMDIAVTLDGQRREFSGVQANSSVSVSSGYVIADSKESVSNWLNNRFQQDTDHIKNHEFYKSDAEQCKRLLGQLNPQVAKENAVDEAINGLQSRVDSIQREFTDMRADTKRILELLGNGAGDRR